MWDGISSHNFSALLLARLAFDHWVCLFLQCLFPTPWYFVEILRTPICYQGFPFQLFLSGVLRRRLQSCQRILFHFTCKLLGILRPISLGVSAIVAALFFFEALVWRGFGGIFIIPELLVMTGSQKFSEVLLRECKWQPGKSSPWPIFSSFLVDKDSMVSLSWYSTGFLLYPYFLIFYEEERIK